MHLHASAVGRDDSPGWSARAAAVATVLAVAFAVLGALVVGGGPLPVDIAIRDALGIGGSAPPILQLLNDVGGAITWDIGVAIVAGILFLTGRRRESAWLGGGVLLGEALSSAAKLIVDRQRPPGIAVQDLVTQASFPSGHATRMVITVALLVVLLARSHWSRIAGVAGVIVVAVLIGPARIESGEHWPTDVLGAYLLAASIIAAVVAVPGRLRSSAPALRLPAPVASPGAARRP